MASAVDRGIMQWSQVQELRQVVSGNVQGRNGPKEIVYAKLMGTGVADVAAAKLAYDKATAAGIGYVTPW